jgi:hypothetical protein
VKEIKAMKEEEENEEPDSNGYWPITTKAVRFAIWTVVFSIVGAIVISFTGFHLGE